MTDDLVKRLRSANDESFVETLCGEAADRIEAMTDALDNLLEAINAEDKFHDRSLTITGPTANLKWLLEAEEEARAALNTGKEPSHDQ